MLGLTYLPTNRENVLRICLFVRFGLCSFSDASVVLSGHIHVHISDEEVYFEVLTVHGWKRFWNCIFQMEAFKSGKQHDWTMFPFMARRDSIFARDHDIHKNVPFPLMPMTSIQNQSNVRNDLRRLILQVLKIAAASGYFLGMSIN